MIHIKCCLFSEFYYFSEKIFHTAKQMIHMECLLISSEKKNIELSSAAVVTSALRIYYLD